MPETLTDQERELVRLIDAGLTRWKIAEVSGLGASRTRDAVRDLCERFECRMDQLPDETGVFWDETDECPLCGAELDEPRECEHRWRDHGKAGVVCRDCGTAAPPDVAAIVLGSTAAVDNHPTRGL